jgi:hypothetical protein
MICPILMGFVILNELVNVVYFVQFISCSDYYGRLFVCKCHGDYLDFGCWITVVFTICLKSWNGNLQRRVTFMGLGDNREVGFDWPRQAALTGAHLNFKLDEMLLWKSATRPFSLYIASALSPVFVSICLSLNSRLGMEWRILIHSHPFFIPGW